jgi:hypothetical protein
MTRKSVPVTTAMVSKLNDFEDLGEMVVSIGSHNKFAQACIIFHTYVYSLRTETGSSLWYPGCHWSGYSVDVLDYWVSRDLWV